MSFEVHMFFAFLVRYLYHKALPQSTPMDVLETMHIVFVNRADNEQWITHRGGVNLVTTCQFTLLQR